MIEKANLFEYLDKARTGHEWDFKVTNGSIGAKKGIDIYRGMIIDRDNYGRPIIASARDVGNIAAGYMSGKAISLP